jgi:choline dehydrogenase-like flavoprotein
MAYVRGHKADFDSWAEHGCKGWSYNDVLPYFIKSENNVGKHAITRDPKYHGTDGPLYVSDIVDLHEVCRTFLVASAESGVPLNQDINGENQLGIGPSQVTMKDAKRWSTAKAFLHPVKSRPNLDILTRAQVSRVLIDSKTKRATGVEYCREGSSATLQVSATKEVILSGGSVGTPQMLMLSGVGPKAHLEEHKIDCISDLPVGSNMQDHIMTVIGYEVQNTVTYGLHSQTVGNILRYLLCRKGPFTSNGLELSGFVETGVRDDLNGAPDIQLHVIAAGATTKDGENLRVAERYQVTDEDIAGKAFVSPISVLLHPKSLGTVRLASSDPNDHPLIDPNYFEHKDDVASVVEGCKLIHDKIMKAGAWEHYKPKLFMHPNLLNDIDAPVGSDKFWEMYTRHTAVTVYHPVGTCTMGDPKDSKTVVDPQCRVLGIKGLRVIDASIMPSLPSGNTNAASIMVGEKGADLIRQTWQSGN